MGADNYKKYEKKMESTVSVLKSDLNTVRAGRANVAVLDKISVDYYGVPTPIAQIGNVTIPEARVLVIQPWDTSILKEVEKAIMTSDLGINPNNDGKVIRLIFPQLTEERRKELTKTVKKYGEESKVAIRSIRRDAIDDFKKQKKNNEMTEDDLKDAEKEVQLLTDKYNDIIDKIVESKVEEVLEV